MDRSKTLAFVVRLTDNIIFAVELGAIKLALFWVTNSLVIDDTCIFGDSYSSLQATIFYAAVQVHTFFTSKYNTK